MATDSFDIDLEPMVSTLVQIYAQLAQCKFKKTCSIKKLGPESLAPILKLLRTKDKKNVRLTCKDFKECIDEHVGMHINLDLSLIDSPTSLPPPGACSLRLRNTQTPQPLDYILNKSDLITSVHFAGQVSVSAFTKIVTRCGNLRRMTFSDRCEIQNGIRPVTVGSVHTLDLGCPGYASEYVGPDCDPYAISLWSTFEILLRRLLLPQLKVFRIFFCCAEDCPVLHRALAQIINFLAGHTSVEDVSISLHHRYERLGFLQNDPNFQRFRVDVPRRILRNIQLTRIQIATMEAAFKVWDCMLPAQKAVTHLDLLNRSRRWFYISKIISNNCKTLKYVRLHNISPESTQTPLIDLGAFKTCKGLETLFLSRFENSTQEVVYRHPSGCEEVAFLHRETSTVAEVKNATMLPTSLKSLHFQGLLIDSKELCEAFKRLRNLTVLELQLTGYHKPPSSLSEKDDHPFLEAGDKAIPGAGFGVNSEVIRSALKNCGKLDILFIEEFENFWTKIRATEFGDGLQNVSLIPGEGYVENGEYYGVLICSRGSVSRQTRNKTRLERMHSWDTRLRQYSHPILSKTFTLKKNSFLNPSLMDMESSGQELEEMERLLEVKSHGPLKPRGKLVPFGHSSWRKCFGTSQKCID